jgi:hypothetical protein
MSQHWAGRTPTADEWRDILEKHARWTRGEADGQRADLQGADLRGADLRRADLQGADLQGADLRRADLPEGDLIGWKKCAAGVVVKLRIPADAKRSHAFGRKCRAEFADVLEVVGGEFGFTDAHGPRTEYRAGQRVTPDAWDSDWTKECSNGVHFFITRAEAEAYLVSQHSGSHAGLVHGSGGKSVADRVRAVLDETPLYLVGWEVSMGKEFGLVIETEDASRIKTVAQAIDFVERALMAPSGRL